MARPARTATLRVMGIDPGSSATGFGVVEVHRDGRITAVESGVIRSKARSFDRRLASIYDRLRELIVETHPDEVAMEDIFYAANVKSALKLGHARGVAILAAVHAGLTVTAYTPLQVKQATVGYGRADKEQVSQMVCMLLGMSEAPASLDASDALAVAICHVHASHLGRTTGVTAR